MSQVQRYNTPIRQGVVQRLQYGDKHVSEMAENLPTVKGNVHYHLQQLEEEGAVVKIDKEYWTKKEAHKKQRRLEQRFNKFKERLEKQISYKPNLGAFYKRYKEFKQQRRRFEKMGFQVPDLTAEDIVRSKKETVKRVLRRKGNATHRKFEQLQEFRKLRDWIERVFGVSLGEDFSKIHTGNPRLTKKLETAFG
jgi:predicted ArsR family transcriptional regulator